MDATATPGSPTGRSEAAGGSLLVEQGRLERRGRLRWFHWLVLALSAALTLLAWHYSRSALEVQTEQRFTSYAEQAIGLFTEKLHSHADLLRASAGLLEASESVTFEEWRRYAEALSLAEQFPAISGLGVIYRVPRASAADFTIEQSAMRPGFDLFPDHAEPLHLPLSLIAPKPLEERVLGFDLAHDPVRRETILEAMSGGAVRITAPLELAARRDLGIIMVAPFRESADGTRRGGVVVASMGPAGLAYGTLAPELRQVAIRVSDGGEALHDEHGNLPATGEEPRHVLSRQVPLYGRLWDFDIHSTPAFHASTGSPVPTLILVGGMVLEGILLTLFIALSRANRHALSFAERMAANAREKSEALELSNEALAASNRELESSNDTLDAFACVVSHDLKAPLLNIGNLVGFVEEDLEGRLDAGGADAEIVGNLRQVSRQVERARALIGGVLTYSRADGQAEAPEPFDVGTLVRDIAETLGVDDGRLRVDGELPVLDTYRTRLDQVLANLIGNAFKYHHDPAGATVRVAAADADATTLRFSVADDGPGIEPRFHEKIFEIFETLERRDDVDGTGVGLSIVKRTVEGMGGTIGVDSAPGRGTTFTFTWPREVEPVAAVRQAA